MDINATPGVSAYALLRRWRVVLGGLLGCLLLNGAYLNIAQWKYQSDALVMVKVNFNAQDLARAEFGQSEQGMPAPQVSGDVIKSLIVSYKTLLKNDAVEREVVERIGAGRLYPGLEQSWVMQNLYGGSTLDKAVKRFDRDIDVRQLKESNILSLTVFNPDPALARQAADRLLSQFISLQQSVFRQPATAFIGNQLDAASREVQQQNLELSQFKFAHRLSSIPDEREQLLQERKDVSEGLGQARSALSAALARRDTIQHSLRAFSDTAGVGAGTDAMSRQLDDAQQRLTAQIERANAARVQYPDDSPMVRNADLAVAQARQRLAELRVETSRTVQSGASPVYQALQTDMLRSQAEVSAADAQVNSLSRDLGSINVRLQELAGAEGELRTLESRAQVAQDNLTTQQQRSVESRISSDLNRSQITSLAVVQKPTLGYEPTRPRWLLTTALSVFMGLCGGIGVAYMLELTRQTARVAELAEYPAGVPERATLAALLAGRR